MKSKGNIKDNCFLIVICILMISFTVNIYQAIENNKYSYELGKQNYNKIEEIRYRNESILSILESCVSAGSVNNSDLLTLHRNYSKITELELSLWSNYLNDNKHMFISKKNRSKNIVVSTTSKNELYSEIEELIYSYIQNEMTEKKDVIELQGKVAENFENLKSMSIDLNNYFNDFYAKNCDLSDEMKEKKMINHDYWIDILQGMQEVNSKYWDYEFIY